MEKVHLPGVDRTVLDALLERWRWQREEQLPGYVVAMRHKGGTPYADTVSPGDVAKRRRRSKVAKRSRKLNRGK